MSTRDRTRVIQLLTALTLVSCLPFLVTRPEPITSLRLSRLQLETAVAGLIRAELVHHDRLAGTVFDKHLVARISAGRSDCQSECANDEQPAPHDRDAKRSVPSHRCLDGGRMVTPPASMASAGSVIEVMALFVLCRGPESNWRHMVLQVMFRAINANSRLKILAKTHGYERQQIVQQKDGEQALPSSFGDRIVRTFSEKSAKRSESRASELHSRSPPRADRPGLALQNPRSVRTWPDDRSVGSVR